MYFKKGSVEKAVTFSVHRLDIFSFTLNSVICTELADIRYEKAGPSFFCEKACSEVIAMLDLKLS
jgi:hypothetical protein